MVYWVIGVLMSGTGKIEEAWSVYLIVVRSLWSWLGGSVDFDLLEETWSLNEGLVATSDDPWGIYLIMLVGIYMVEGEPRGEELLLLGARTGESKDKAELVVENGICILSVVACVVWIDEENKERSLDGSHRDKLNERKKGADVTVFIGVDDCIKGPFSSANGKTNFWNLTCLDT